MLSPMVISVILLKNCGLKGEEIDGNFNFLRGHDIESISFDENDNLVIKRYDGSVLTTVKTEKPEYNFAYDTNFWHIDNYYP